MDQLGARFKLWGLLAVASAVSMGAVVTSSPKPRGHDQKYVLACVSISLIISTIYTAMIRLWKSSEHDDTLQKIEGGVAFILFILWAAAISVINELNSFNTSGAMYVVANGNVYYFTWACFFLVLAILGNSMQNLSLSDPEKSARTSKWMVLAATSIIVMAACISIFRASDCKNDNSKFCVATKLGLGIGCCCGFVALVLMCVIGKAAGDNPNKFIQIEAVLGLCFMILYAVTVAFVTGPGGPGATIGNLYYSTWLSFFASVAVTLDCVSIVTRDMKLPTLSEGTGASPPKEMAAPSAPAED